MEPSQLAYGIIAFLSLLGSMFASFSELSLFIVDRVKLHKLILKDKKKSKYLKVLLENHRETLITILFMNMFFNTVFTISVSNLLISLSAIASTIIISAFIAFFGEILPKVGGYSVAEKTAIELSKVIYFVNFLGKFLFKFVDRRLIHPFMKRSMYLSRKDKAELVEILKRNTRNPKYRKFMEILDMDAKDIMIPISDTVAVGVETSNLPKDLNLSYVLVYEGNRNNIVGVVNLDSFLKSYVYNTRISDYIEPVNFVPETKKVYDLILEMKQKSIFKTLIIDEYGNVIGVVYPETIFSYVFSSDVEKIKKLDDNLYVVYGDTTLAEFNEIFLTDIQSQFYNTISGFIIESFGRIPNKGEKIKIDGLEVIIKDVNEGKIDEIIIKTRSKSNSKLKSST
ncbi:MAG: CNNM domain-containing protein [Brevinematales bacterium]|nr:CNNM domain-containing protein [Brevinematales bacterium]